MRSLLADSYPQQLAAGAVEEVLVAGEGASRSVLPERVGAPAGRQRARGGAVTGDPQRIVGGESGVVAGALRPPVASGVDDRPDCGEGLVGVGEAGDPRHHRGLAEPVALGTIGV